MAYGDPPTDYKPHVAYLARQREALRARISKLYTDRQKHFRTGLRLVETAGGAAIAGIIQGKAGEGGAHILRMPASLVIGAVLVGGGIFEAAGGYSDHLIDLGSGFIAEFAGNWGYGVGQRWNQTGHFGLFGHNEGHALPPGGAHTGADLTPSQMANLVRQVQAAG